MPRNIKLLEEELKKAIKDSSKKAFESTFDVNLGKKDVNDTKEQVSKRFAETFSKELAPELAKVIENYIASITPIPILVSPAGPVTGTITLT